MAAPKPVRMKGSIYASAGIAAEIHGTTAAMMRNWCNSKNPLYDDFQWVDLRLHSYEQLNIVDRYTIEIADEQTGHVERYGSFADAAKAIGMSEKTVRYRLSRPDYYPNYSIRKHGRLDRSSR